MKKENLKREKRIAQGIVDESDCGDEDAEDYEESNEGKSKTRRRLVNNDAKGTQQLGKRTAEERQEQLVQEDPNQEYIIQDNFEVEEGEDPEKKLKKVE